MRIKPGLRLVQRPAKRSPRCAGRSLNELLRQNARTCTWRLIAVARAESAELVILPPDEDFQSLIRWAEIGVVKGVERVKSDLELVVFVVGHVEILVDGHIEVFYARAVEHVAFRVPIILRPVLARPQDSPIGQRLRRSGGT